MPFRLLLLGAIFYFIMGVAAPDAHAQQKSQYEKGNEKKNKGNRKLKRRGDKGKSNKRQLRTTKFKTKSKQGERAFSGNITGRKFQTKRSPRPQWGANIAKPNPYAGRKRNTEASRAKAAKQTPRYSSQSQSQSRERAWKGNSAGRAAAGNSRGITFTGKKSYQGSASRSISRGSERPKKVTRITPRSSSGAYSVRKRKNPYLFKQKSPWEKAYQGDITGRRFQTKRTKGRPGIKRPTKTRYTSKRGRQGDKSYQGKMPGGFKSVSRASEKSGASSGGAGARRTQRITFTGKRAYQGSGASGRSISRGSESSKKVTRVTPRSSSGAYNVRKRKNPYVFKQKSPWEKAFQGDITGRKFRTKRTVERPAIQRPGQTKYSRKGGRKGDRSYQGRVQGGYKSISRTSERAWNKDISGNKLRVRTSEKPKFGGTQFQTYPKGKRRNDHAYKGRIKGGGYKSVSSHKEKEGSKSLRSKPPRTGAMQAVKFQGNMKARKPLKGGGSISGGTWNNRGRVVEGRGTRDQDKRGAKFQGNIKGGKPLKGGGSISGGTWNNRGRAVEGRGTRDQDKLGAKFQGNIKGGKPLKGGGSISGKSWNNRGRAVEGRGTREQDKLGAKFQGNLKGGKPFKGGGSISGKSWNNKGMAIKGRDPREQDIRSLKFQGNIKSSKPVKGGGSISRNDWNNKGKAVQGRGAKSQDNQIAKFQGNLKAGKSDLAKINSQKASGYRGKKTYAYLHQKGPEDSQKYKGNVKQLSYKKNKNASDNSLKVIKPVKNERLSANFKGFNKSRDTYRQNKSASDESLKKKYPEKDYFKGGEFQGNIKRSSKYKQNPNSADESLKNKPPGRGTAKGSGYQGNMKMMTYKKRPHAADDALKGRGPSRAAIQASSYQGNVKMNKKSVADRHPDFKYLSSKSNGKAEKDKVFSFKLLWSRMFKKEENQPSHLKEKERKPRYDKKEKDLWND